MVVSASGTIEEEPSLYQRGSKCALSCGVLLALFFYAISAFPQEKKSGVYQRIVPVGYAIFRDGKLCLPILVSMTSGDFFDGLKVAETPSLFHSPLVPLSEPIRFD